MDFKDEILNYLDATDVDSLDKFKEKFNSKFIPLNEAHKYPDVASKVIGKRMGEITSKLVDFGKTFGIEETFDSLKEKKVEEAIDYFKETLSGKMGELKEASKSGNDKKVNDLTKQLEDMQKSISSYKEANEKLRSEYDGFKSQSENNIRSYKINHQIENLKNKISWVDDLTDVQRVGYDAALKTNYHFDLDEKDNLVVKDKEGKLIQKKDKAGAFAEPFEILEQLAEANKLKKMNNATQKSSIFAINKPVPKGELDTKKVSSAYLKRIGK